MRQVRCRFPFGDRLQPHCRARSLTTQKHTNHSSNHPWHHVPSDVQLSLHQITGMWVPRHAQDRIDRFSRGNDRLAARRIHPSNPMRWTRSIRATAPQTSTWPRKHQEPAGHPRSGDKSPVRCDENLCQTRNATMNERKSQDLSQDVWPMGMRCGAATGPDWTRAVRVLGTGLRLGGGG